MVLSVDKIQEESRIVFEQLPDILIQDPVNQCSYLLIADEMDKYEVNSSTWTQLDSNVVTFSIPSAEEVHEIPPFNSASDQEPSILIQYPDGETSYLLTHEQLQEFITEQPTEKAGYGISFVIPMGMEMIEELPAMMKSMLQSTEVVTASVYERF